MPSKNLPKRSSAKKYKDQWDLKALYYTSEKDPRIEEDVRAAEAAYARFAKKYVRSAFTTSVTVLAQALKDKEAMLGEPRFSRPGRYFGFRRAVNAADAVAEKQLNLISDRLTKAGNSTLFFGVQLSKIPKQQQRVFLKAPELAKYRYYLSELFKDGAHTLTEAEERILNLQSNVSYEMWVDGTEKILSKTTLSFNGKTVPLPEAIETVNTLPAKQRSKLWHLVLDELAPLSAIAENEYNAIITNAKTLDELRGYERPFSSTVSQYEYDEPSLRSLLDVVSTRGFKLSADFYKLKASLHGTKQLAYEHRNLPIGKPRRIPYEKAVNICKDVFYSIDEQFGRIFESMLTHGQVDVFPRHGKRGGAFMSNAIGHPTHVFLNHTNDFQSLETLAHEMGHAFHSELSKVQSPLYENYSICTAETASTLFENLVFDAVYEKSSDATRLVLLHDRILRDISTIQRQIAFFNCELEIHETIRSQGAMTKEELSRVTARHLRSYLGNSVRVTERDGLSFVYINHFRYGFYVFTYAFGLIMSSALAERYKRDRNELGSLKKLLSAGGSDTVRNIFKSVGIKTDDRATYESGLDRLERDIAAFKSLISKRRLHS